MMPSSSRSKGYAPIPTSDDKRSPEDDGLVRGGEEASGSGSGYSDLRANSPPYGRPASPAYPPRTGNSIFLPSPSTSSSTFQRVYLRVRGFIKTHRTLLRNISLVILIVPVVLWLILSYTPLAIHPVLLPPTLRDAKNLLVVVAHPDDECLFFSPAITTVLRRGGLRPEEKTTGHVLVMSSGNHYGLGDLRKKELKGSCQELGVTDESRCEVLNLDEIQDDPTYWWPTDKLVDVIKPYIDRWSIDAVVTFDSGGVSGHINHRAVSAALVKIAQTPSLKPPAVYTSLTVPVLRKYSGLLDLPLSTLPFIFTPHTDQKGLLVGTFGQYLAARKAFWSHQSQLVWDRHLYMIISRYMWFVRLDRVS